MPLPPFTPRPGAGEDGGDGDGCGGRLNSCEDDGESDGEDEGQSDGDIEGMAPSGVSCPRRPQS